MFFYFWILPEPCNKDTDVTNKLTYKANINHHINNLDDKNNFTNEDGDDGLEDGTINTSLFLEQKTNQKYLQLKVKIKKIPIVV